MAGVTNPQAGNLGWIAAIVLGLIVIGQCSSKEIATESEDPAPARTQKYVHARALNCREMPSRSALVLRSLVRNDLVEIMDEQIGWVQISGEPQCWVSAAFLGDGRVIEPVASPVQGFLSSGFRSGGDGAASRRRSRSRSSALAGTYYSNCSAARAAGAAPVYANDPGYSRRLDRDGDGVGCE